MGLWILALILAIPLGIAANLFTPAIRNQLSRLSSKWTARRIRSIEKQLKQLDERDFVAEIFKLLQTVISILMCIVFGLAFNQAAMVQPTPVPGGMQPVATPETLRIWAFLLFSLGVFLGTYGSAGLRRLIHPEWDRPYLEKSLASLREKQQKELGS